MKNFEQTFTGQEIGKTPEIKKVMSNFDKELQRLDENVASLTLQLSSVLTSETLKDVHEDRGVRECKLAEEIQKDIDFVERINDIIDDLRNRIEL